MAPLTDFHSFKLGLTHWCCRAIGRKKHKTKFVATGLYPFQIKIDGHQLGRGRRDFVMEHIVDKHKHSAFRAVNAPAVKPPCLYIGRHSAAFTEDNDAVKAVSKRRTVY